MSDSISRQAAIDTMMALQAEDDERYGCSIPESFDGERAVEALMQLPSAEPERKKGKWIRNQAQTPWPICSECGVYGANESNYCPNCGAYMKGEKDVSD